MINKESMKRMQKIAWRYIYQFYQQIEKQDVGYRLLSLFQQPVF
jgi:hypothetical protein